MSTPIRAGDRDLRALAAIVSQDRPDLPDGEGLPPSLLADLMGQIRCDEIGLGRYDSGRQGRRFLQHMPTLSDDELKAFEDWDLALDEHLWACHWDCQSRSYPERTGDLRSIVKTLGFLLGPAMAQHRHVQRFLSHRCATSISFSCACPIPRRPDQSLGLTGPSGCTSGAGPGRISRARPGGAHAAAPAPAPGRPGRRAAPPPGAPAHPAANGAAAPAGRRAHQHPDRPPPRHIRVNRAHPPGAHLRKAACLQPHRRSNPRLPRPGCVVGVDQRQIGEESHPPVRDTGAEPDASALRALTGRLTAGNWDGPRNERLGVRIRLA